MPIAKGEDWGTEGELPPGARIFQNDAALSRAVEYAAAKRLEMPICGLVGGDLWRTLGAPPGGTSRLRGGLATQVTVDVGWLRFDEGELEHAFVAHCIARTRWWGEVVAVMNAEWLDEWDVAPKGHPGDGWLDVTAAALSWPERQKVRERLPTGTHLPHPDLKTSRVREAVFEFERPRRLYLDRVPFSRVSRLEVRVQPASLTVVV